jgi:hypothetical protein
MKCLPSRAARPVVCAVLLTGALAACDPGGGPATEDDAPETASLSLSGGWSSEDIGTVAARGSADQSNGVYTVKGSGADIYGTADAFHFAHQQLSGNATIVARVTSLQNTNSSAKAVVMIREDLRAGARFVAAELTPLATNKYRVHSRSALDGTAVMTKTTTDSAIPSWLRVVRSGSSFTASYSTNGTTWKTIGATMTVSMRTVVYVGLGVTSHADGTLATAKFDNVAVTGTLSSCSPNATSCTSDHTAMRTCTSSGTWLAPQLCPFTCVGTVCGGVCKPGDRRCSGTGVQLCSSSGAWTPVACAGTCSGGGQCVGQCMPGQTSCQGLNAMSCDQMGFWRPNGCSATCGSVACQGVCLTLNSAPFYCLIDPPGADLGSPPGSGDICSMNTLGKSCSMDVTGTPCNSATQTYLYQYSRTTGTAYALVTSRYYVCDNNTWQPGS